MTHIITGVFRTRATAEAVVAHLASHDGLSRDQMRMSAMDPAAEAAHRGIWSSVKNQLLPDADGAVQAAALRRGGILLSARVEEALVDHTLDVFRRNGAMDLDAAPTEAAPADMPPPDGAAAISNSDLPAAESAALPHPRPGPDAQR
jgi:hypothetical protein